LLWYKKAVMPKKKVIATILCFPEY
jgi:hypothetical protein